MNTCPAVRLKVRGHIPSFKNTKMIARGRLITDPKKQRRMAGITADLLSGLRSWCQTAGIETETAPFQRFLTAGLLPLDDSLAWIGTASVAWRRVSKGQEGAEIVINRNDEANHLGA